MRQVSRHEHSAKVTQTGSWGGTARGSGYSDSAGREGPVEWGQEVTRSHKGEGRAGAGKNVGCGVSGLTNRAP